MVYLYGSDLGYTPFKSESDLKSELSFPEDSEPSQIKAYPF
ncbi:hypothetical protein M8C21_002557 [Ambrosia artemisiifolia]|uniref:Uncharacterized protein n=1 Tax=Ambrosia artemisiifolia TaxID=4212 RepID=A0AAD5BX58_AMBAR|nr:hypothetical protein M8C21_002557 [Ambrosia artemisiifolia]